MKRILFQGMSLVFVFSLIIQANYAASTNSQPPPTLGTYTNTTIFEGENIIVRPSVTPAGAVSIVADATSVGTSPEFQGIITVEPTSGAVYISNARPAGTYTIRLTATASDNTTSTANFNLTVITEKGCTPFSVSNLTGTATFSTGAATDTPQFGVVADFNKDGRQDFVAGVFVGDKASVFLGNGIGGFSPVTTLTAPTGASTQFVAVGDFNGDGNPDIAATNVNTDNLSVWLGNGDGTFRTRVDRALFDAPRSIVVGDFNNDGKQDLAVVSSTLTNVGVLLGVGDGTFANPVSVALGGTAFALAVGDFNNDGNEDLFTGVGTSGRMLLGNGTGGFTVSTVGTFNTGTEWASVGDFNNDGNLDVVIDNTGATNNVNVFLGNGSGGLTNAPGSPFTVGGAGVYGNTVGDFDGDGNLDLAVSNLTQNNVTIYRGAGTGAFTSVGTITGITGPRGLNFADLNNDGRQDLIIIERSAGRITARLGACPVEITTSGLLVARQNQAYTASIAVTGGTTPYTFSATGLPAGLTINQTTGVISGTPTVTGTFYPRITVTDTTSGTPVQSYRVIRLRVVAARQTLFDFDGDARSDLSVYRNNTWFLQRSTAGFLGVQFGIASDKLTPADFDGDGRTDIAVWRENAQNNRASFYILQSSNNTFRADQFGAPGDDPRVVGDWDGDGRADPAIYRPNAKGTQSGFFFRPSSQPGVDFRIIYWGTAGDEPQRGDFDGDGRLDAAVYRPSDGIWYIRQSSDNLEVYVRWGLGSDKRVPADYDGDGRTDVAVFRDGIWYIIDSSSSQTRLVRFGSTGDIIVQGDYDGDGRADYGVFRGGIWYVLNSGNNQQTVARFGDSTDRTVPSAYLP